eukprot:12542557-Alexandrium_andersonii.AAC.1
MVLRCAVLVLVAPRGSGLPCSAQRGLDLLRAGLLLGASLLYHLAVAAQIQVGRTCCRGLGEAQGGKGACAAMKRSATMMLDAEGLSSQVARSSSTSAGEWLPTGPTTVSEIWHWAPGLLDHLQQKFPEEHRTLLHNLEMGLLINTDYTGMGGVEIAGSMLCQA